MIVKINFGEFQRILKNFESVTDDSILMHPVLSFEDDQAIHFYKPIAPVIYSAVVDKNQFETPEKLLVFRQEFMRSVIDIIEPLEMHYMPMMMSKQDILKPVAEALMESMETPHGR